jgi:GAF domain-containing protein
MARLDKPRRRRHGEIMRDDLVGRAVEDGDQDAIRAILADVCSLTDMGFAAVARVTEDRWIVCQVLDKIEFGLTPGGELEVATTICDEIREHGEAVIFDDASAEPDWRTHPVPILYGFKSYASFPIFLSNGDFYGTLCAIDPARRTIATPQVIATLRAYAAQVAALLEARATRTA